MTAAQKTESLHLGTLEADLLPHYIRGVGPRVFVVLNEGPAHLTANLTPETARAWSDYLKIAACQAEALERQEQRRQEAAAHPPSRIAKEIAVK